MKNLNAVIIMVGILSAISGCASSYTYDQSSAPGRSYETQEDAVRSVIKSAFVEIEVNHPPKAAEVISVLIEQESGYLDSSNNNDQERITIIARVPQARLEAIVETVASKGTLIQKSFSAEDVTEQMIDIAARLKNLQVLREKFRDLLDRAEKVSEILDIEKELARIQTEIDSIEGRMASLKDQVAYSRLHITIDKKTTYGPLGYLFKGVYWGVKKLFVMN